MISLSLAITAKTWPILIALAFFKRMKNKALFVFLLAAPLIATLLYSWFYHTSVKEIILTVKNYRGLWGFWGISAVSNLLGRQISLYWQALLRKLLFGIYIIYTLIEQKDKLLNKIIVLLLFFFVITPIAVPHYLMWLIPFLILDIKNHKKYYLFFVVSGIFLAVANMRDIGIVIPANIFKTLFFTCSITSWLMVIRLFMLSSPRLP